MISGENEEGWAYSDEEAAREAGLLAPDLSTEIDPEEADKAQSSLDKTGNHAPAVAPDESGHTVSDYPAQPEKNKPSSDQAERPGYQNDADPPR